MAKRFTDNTKWKRWFRDLNDKYKILWLWLHDYCDHAGVWEVDFENAEHFTGHKYDYKKVLDVFGDKIIETYDDKIWFITDFPELQYGVYLNPKNRTHNSVIEILKKYDLIKYTDLMIKDKQ